MISWSFCVFWAISLFKGFQCLKSASSKLLFWFCSTFFVSLDPLTWPLSCKNLPRLSLTSSQAWRHTFFVYNTTSLFPLAVFLNKSVMYYWPSGFFYLFCRPSDKSDCDLELGLFFCAFLSWHRGSCQCFLCSGQWLSSILFSLLLPLKPVVCHQPFLGKCTVDILRSIYLFI